MTLDSLFLLTPERLGQLSVFFLQATLTRAPRQVLASLLCLGFLGYFQVVTKGLEQIVVVIVSNYFLGLIDLRLISNSICTYR